MFRLKDEMASAERAYEMSFQGLEASMKLKTESLQAQQAEERRLQKDVHDAAIKEQKELVRAVEVALTAERETLGRLRYEMVQLKEVSREL